MNTTLECSDINELTDFQTQEIVNHIQPNMFSEYWNLPIHFVEPFIAGFRCLIQTLFFVDLAYEGQSQDKMHIARIIHRMYFGFYTIFLKDVKCGDLYLCMVETYL